MTLTKPEPNVQRAKLLRAAVDYSWLRRRCILFRVEALRNGTLVAAGDTLLRGSFRCFELSMPAWDPEQPKLLRVAALLGATRKTFERRGFLG